MNLSTIKKKREALEQKLKTLTEKQRVAMAKEKQEATMMAKKAFEKNKAALAMILVRQHADGFENLNLEVLKAEVNAILDPKIKENQRTPL